MTLSSLKPTKMYQTKLQGAEPNAGMILNEGANAEVNKYPRPKTFAATPIQAFHLLNWLPGNMTNEMTSPARYKHI